MSIRVRWPSPVENLARRHHQCRDIETYEYFSLPFPSLGTRFRWFRWPGAARLAGHDVLFATAGEAVNLVVHAGLKAAVEVARPESIELSVPGRAGLGDLPSLSCGRQEHYSSSRKSGAAVSSVLHRSKRACCLPDSRSSASWANALLTRSSRWRGTGGPMRSCTNRTWWPAWLRRRWSGFPHSVTVLVCRTSTHGSRAVRDE